MLLIISAGNILTLIQFDPADLLESKNNGEQEAKGNIPRTRSRRKRRRRKKKRQREREKENKSA